MMKKLFVMPHTEECNDKNVDQHQKKQMPPALIPMIAKVYGAAPVVGEAIPCIMTNIRGRDQETALKDRDVSTQVIHKFLPLYSWRSGPLF